jgi:transcriptional regulator with XRE-family HTH domain
MTPVQFKDARKALGLTQKECAKALGLKTSRAIRQYQTGERQVSGPVAVLVAMLLEQANGKDATPPEENK